MIPASLVRTIERIPTLAERGAKVAQAIHGGVLHGGDRVRRLVDVLHGTWLGHPLHPALTDVPVGAWTLAAFFDAMVLASGSVAAAHTADRLTVAGAVVAVPTALAGLADYAAIDQTALGVGAAHGLLNTTGLALSLLSIKERAAGHRGRGVCYSATALGILLVSAWLGGEMVYRYRIGVNHEEGGAEPAEWTAVCDATALAERTPKRAVVNDVPILLYREGESVVAIGVVCSHAGGPLDEGTIRDGCVECPWHNSVFALRTGAVVHGPATFPEPAYETRVTDGRVEVRYRPPGGR